MNAVGSPSIFVVDIANCKLDCGNEFANEPTLAPEGLAGCSQTCLGNNTEFCGAGNRLDVYKLDYIGVSSTISQSSTV